MTNHQDLTVLRHSFPVRLSCTLDAEQPAGTRYIPVGQALAQRPAPVDRQELDRHEGKGEASIGQEATEGSGRRAEVGCRHAPPPGPWPATPSRSPSLCSSRL